MAKSDTLQIILGHKRPAFRIWQEWQFATWEPTSDSDFLIRAQTSAQLPSNIASEYRYLFAIARQLKSIDAPQVKTIKIAHYRRLVVNQIIGRPSTNMPWANVISPQEAEQLSASTLTEAVNSELLITKAFSCDSILRQYHSSHHCRDLLRFLSDAIDGYVIDDADACAALSMTALIPAPTVGSFPISIFLDLIQTLERAALCYVENGFIQRDAYQARSIGFCLERLHSFLLFKLLQKKGIKLEDATGCQVTVSETSSIQPTI
jgi:hypothetical protein